MNIMPIEATNKTISIFPIGNSSDRAESLDRLIEISEVVVLEDVKEKNLIVKIDKAVIVKDKIFVLDKEFSSFNIYNRNGSYIRQVGEIGEGPGQYLNIDDFIIDEVNNNIIILSNNQQKIHFFDLNGEYIKSSSIGFFTYKFVCTESEIIYFTNFNPAEHTYNLLITNKSGEVKSVAFPFNPDTEHSGIAFSGFLNDYGQEILFSVPFSNRIYSYSNGELLSKYFFDFGSKIPNEEINDFRKLFQNLINYSFIRHNIVESNSHLFFDFQHNSKINSGIYNKKTNRCFTYNKVSSDSFLEKILDSPKGLLKNNLFISPIDLENYNHFKERKKEHYKTFTGDYPNLSKKLAMNNENITPILLIFKIK